MLHLFSELSEDVIITMLHRFCAEAVKVFFCIALYKECEELLVFVTPAYMFDSHFWTMQFLLSLRTLQDRRNGWLLLNWYLSVVFSCIAAARTLRRIHTRPKQCHLFPFTNVRGEGNPHESVQIVKITGAPEAETIPACRYSPFIILKGSHPLRW